MCTTYCIVVVQVGFKVGSFSHCPNQFKSSQVRLKVIHFVAFFEDCERKSVHPSQVCFFNTSISIDSSKFPIVVTRALRSLLLHSVQVRSNTLKSYPFRRPQVAKGKVCIYIQVRLFRYVLPYRSSKLPVAATQVSVTDCDNTSFSLLVVIIPLSRAYPTRL